MYAVEFETDIDNGLVRVPVSFRKLQTMKKAKIIIMVEDEAIMETGQAGSFDDLFDAPAGAFSSAQEIDSFIREERGSWDK